jgi:broad specificity phosphatase PhoE
VRRKSLAQVWERVYSFLQKVARTMAGRRILIVSHSGTMWCFRYVLERWTYEKAERSFRTETNPKCAGTWYERDTQGRRLQLVEAGLVQWK